MNELSCTQSAFAVHVKLSYHIVPQPGNASKLLNLSSLSSFDSPIGAYILFCD